MELDKRQIVELFLRRGDLTQAQLADESLPDQVDLREHRDLLDALGIDAGLLATQVDNLEP